MLKEKVDILLKSLSFDITSLANAAGVDHSIISRIRSGARVPKRNSTSIDKLVKGTLSLSAKENKLSELCSLIGCSDSMLPDEIGTALMDWLYEEKESGEMLFAPLSGSGGRHFGSKLSQLMSLAGMTSADLGRAVSVDPSYISRMRSGERVPSKDSAVLYKMCSAMNESISDSRRTEELSRLMEILPEVAEGVQAEDIARWLIGNDPASDTAPVRRLISRIEELDLNGEMSDVTVRPHASDITADCSKSIYIGIDGLREAVVRFLQSAYASGAQELLLYSDQSMKWLDEGFTEQWLAMMMKVLKNGTTIKIAHNIERGSKEMINAIVDWLPLYLSGQIEPYYSLRRVGDRFGHTLFLSPERECISAFCVRSCEKYCEYRYITDKEGLESVKMQYGVILDHCRKLVRISRAMVPPPPGAPQRTIGSVQMFIENGVVHINKLTNPGLSFRFDHPLVLDAFRSFI